jgi:hypothetical protein
MLRNEGFTSRKRYHAASLIAGLLIFMASSAWSCEIPGYAEDWAIDYCMVLIDTDDEMDFGVLKCLTNMDIDDSCETVAFYKTEYCKLLIADGNYSGSTQSCQDDRSIMGPTVKSGV